MRKILSSTAVVCLTLAVFTSTASAATITLDATSRGYFRSDGTVTGGHGTASANYLAGHYQTRESRNFFIFDLGDGLPSVPTSTPIRVGYQASRVRVGSYTRTCCKWVLRMS